MKVLASYNIKGGVGKTAAAVNLAFLSARGGARTLVWDLDPQGAATFYFRVRPRIKGGGKKLIRGKRAIDDVIRGTDYEGLDLVPADFSYRHLDLALDRTARPRKRLRRLLEPLADEYDRIFLDCPPSLSLVSESVFAASDALLVPTIPTTLSLHTLEQIRRHLDRIDGRRPRLLPYLCMVDGRKTMHRRICDEVGEGAVPFLHARIPYSSIVEQMGPRRAPLSTYAPGAPAATAFEALWAEIENALRNH